MFTVRIRTLSQNRSPKFEFDSENTQKAPEQMHHKCPRMALESQLAFIHDGEESNFNIDFAVMQHFDQR